MIKKANNKVDKYMKEITEAPLLSSPSGLFSGSITPKKSTTLLPPEEQDCKQTLVFSIRLPFLLIH